jgi:hypothetical protein
MMKEGLRKACSGTLKAAKAAMEQGGRQQMDLTASEKASMEG